MGLTHIGTYAGETVDRTRQRRYIGDPLLLLFSQHWMGLCPFALTSPLSSSWAGPPRAAAAQSHEASLGRSINRLDRSSVPWSLQIFFGVICVSYSHYMIVNIQLYRCYLILLMIVHPNLVFLTFTYYVFNIHSFPSILKVWLSQSLFGVTEFYLHFCIECMHNHDV